MVYRYDTADTIVAPATPPGTGAIAVVRLSGSEAIAIANALLPKVDLAKVKSRTVQYGVLSRDGEELDEVLVTVFRAPHSYTGEDVVEISTHGSMYVVRKLVQWCIDAGARMAEPGEFTMRAFFNRKMDLSQAEAVIDIIQADSAAAHRQAMLQLRGAYSEQLRLLRQKIIEFAALLELELDFGEEDVEFADRTQLQGTLQEILRLTGELRDSYRLGVVVKEGVPTVIAGRPNVGKSTLLNALLREQRAIVSDIPGTTRDVIEASLLIKGVRFRLIDTAGLRQTTDTVEAIGVQRAKEYLQKSQLVLYVFDATEQSFEAAKAEWEKLELPHAHVLFVANKWDMVGDGERPVCNHQECIAISALHGHGLDALKDRMYEMVIGDTSLQEKTLVTNARHYQALVQAHEALERALQGLEESLPADLIAMDIRQASHHLGAIIGEVDPEDLLDYIFANFCIGK